MPRTPSSDLARQRLERGGAADDVQQLVDRERSPIVIATSCWARTSSGLRGSIVCSIDAVVHALDDDGGLEEVAAVLGEDHALRRLADLVPGAADALEAARDGGGALDLDHEVDGAHVDAELEAATSRRGRGGGRPSAPPRSRGAAPCAMLPWWARTSSSPASSLRRCASRSARRRLLVNTIVAAVARGSAPGSAGGSPARCSCASRRRAPGRPAARPSAGPRRGAPCPRPAR